MGAFDGILGNLKNLMGGTPQGGTGQPGSGGGSLMATALQLLEQNGGIPGVLAKFQQAGLARQAQSWVSTGGNLPISAGDLQKALGPGAIGQIAARLGLPQGEAGSGLATLLPQLIDKLTPQGQVPENHQDLVAQGLAMIEGVTRKA